MNGPLIVQSDKTVLLEVDHAQAAEARAALAPFAELERAPEHVHTYRITPLALWNARAAGHDAEQVVDALVSFSRYAVPQPLLVDIVDTMARYGRLQLVKHPAHGLTLVSFDRAVLEERGQLARDVQMDDTDRAFAEMRLDGLPSSTAAAVSELQDYPWQSSQARADYEQIKDLLGREVLDQRFAGMKQALEGATEEDRQAISQMLADLNELLAKHAYSVYED